MSGMKIGRLTVDPQTFGQRWYTGNSTRAQSAIRVLEQVSDIVPIRLATNEGILNRESTVFGPWNMQGWSFEEGRVLSDPRLEQTNEWAIAFLSAVDAIPKGAEWLAFILEKQAATTNTGVARIDEVGRDFGRERPSGDFPANHLAWFLRDRARGLDLSLYEDKEGLERANDPNGDELGEKIRDGRVNVAMPLALQFLDRLRGIGEEVGKDLRLMGVFFREAEFIQYGGQYQHTLEEVWTSPEMAPYLLPHNKLNKLTEIFLGMARARKENPHIVENESLLGHGRFDPILLSLYSDKGILEITMCEQRERSGERWVQLELNWNQLVADQKIQSLLLTAAREPKLD